MGPRERSHTRLPNPRPARCDSSTQQSSISPGRLRKIRRDRARSKQRKHRIAHRRRRAARPRRWPRIFVPRHHRYLGLYRIPPRAASLIGRAESAEMRLWGCRPLLPESDRGVDVSEGSRDYDSFVPPKALTSPAKSRTVTVRAEWPCFLKADGTLLMKCTQTPASWFVPKVNPSSTLDIRAPGAVHHR